jgi:hypothetical protein
MTTLTAADTVVFRVASGECDRAVRRLADLDSAPRPSGPVIVAEVEGQPRAALSLVDGTVVADPFHPTAGLVEMLRMRAALNQPVTRAPRVRVGRWRVASPTGRAAA